MQSKHTIILKPIITRLFSDIFLIVNLTCIEKYFINGLLSFQKERLPSVYPDVFETIILIFDQCLFVFLDDNNSESNSIYLISTFALRFLMGVIESCYKVMLTNRLILYVGTCTFFQEIFLRKAPTINISLCPHMLHLESKTRSTELSKPALDHNLKTECLKMMPAYLTSLLS